MRSPYEMDTIQIDITNACINQCSNCTHLCGHYKNPYFMDLDYFCQAVDSLDLFPHRIGLIGGEPLLHPDFEKMCFYLRNIKKIDKMRLGLWTCFPESRKFYRKVICNTFGAVYLNDHSKPGIFHAPVLVDSGSVPLDIAYKRFLISKCWLQNNWSASITPNGAYFCEVAACFATIKNYPGWPIKSKWWLLTPERFGDQMQLCLNCGIAMPLKRRQSIDKIDDISTFTLCALKDSPKIKRGLFELWDGKLAKPWEMDDMFAFSELEYRQKIAAKFGIKLHGYVTPYLPEEQERAAIKEAGF